MTDALVTAESVEAFDLEMKRAALLEKRTRWKYLDEQIAKLEALRAAERAEIDALALEIFDETGEPTVCAGVVVKTEATHTVDMKAAHEYAMLNPLANAGLLTISKSAYLPVIGFLLSSELGVKVLEVDRAAYVAAYKVKQKALEAGEIAAVDMPMQNIAFRRSTAVTGSAIEPTTRRPYGLPNIFLNPSETPKDSDSDTAPF